MSTFSNHRILKLSSGVKGLLFNGDRTFCKLHKVTMFIIEASAVPNLFHLTNSADMCSSCRAKIRGKCSTGMNELPNPSCKPSDICSQIKHSFPQIPGNAERITLLLRSCLTEALALRTHSEDEEGQDFCPAHVGCYKPLGTTSCFNYEHVCMEKVFLGFNLRVKSVNLLRNVPMFKKKFLLSLF